MRERMKKVCALSLAAVTAFSMVACGSKDAGADNGAANSADSSASASSSTYDTLVVGTQSMEGVFNPYFYGSAYDAQVNDA
ncbi:MAG: hypothetical protein HUJ70_15680, partial [Pseudobutyrivibrio sp.]|nr:hypothetical protein [Pseudobutyrivibrio sp.]